jgi:hypothetical protein
VGPNCKFLHAIDWSSFITSPGDIYCFNTTEEDAEFWQDTVAVQLNETISGNFNFGDPEALNEWNELYSQANATEQKIKTFSANCQTAPSGQYLKYIGTSSTVRDLASLGDAIVGQDQPIYFWGTSYGTVIGFNFVKSKFSSSLAIPAGW